MRLHTYSSVSNPEAMSTESKDILIGIEYLLINTTTSDAFILNVPLNFHHLYQPARKSCMPNAFVEINIPDPLVFAKELNTDEINTILNYCSSIGNYKHIYDVSYLPGNNKSYSSLNISAVTPTFNYALLSGQQGINLTFSDFPITAFHNFSVHFVPVGCSLDRSFVNIATATVTTIGTLVLLFIIIIARWQLNSSKCVNLNSVWGGESK